MAVARIEGMACRAHPSRDRVLSRSDCERRLDRQASRAQVLLLLLLECEFEFAHSISRESERKREKSAPQSRQIGALSWLSVIRPRQNEMSISLFGLAKTLDLGEQSL